jgi:hypothetical protein
MPLRRSLSLLAVAAAAAAAGLTAGPPAAGAAHSAGGGTRIVDLQRPAPVREYAGWLLFSRWDGKAYRLSTWHGGELRDLAVPAQSKPFDADAGPDSAGHPSAVYSRCAGSCDLHVIGFDPGDRPRPVRNANTEGRDEIAPSVWRGELVFARRYGKDHVVPYTKPIRAPRARPSRRLAGLPGERCGAVDPPGCRPIADVDLPAMDLWGRWVAQSWTYQPEDFPGFRQDEIRLTDLARTDTRQVAAMTTGLGGQTYLGPSLAKGRLAFFRACQGDPGGCSTRDSGAFRYRISTGDYELAGVVEGWSGWAWDGAAGYHVPSDFDCGGGDPGTPVEPCGIIRRTDLAWHPVDRAPVPGHR